MNQQQFDADNAPDDGENKLEWWNDFRGNPIRALFDNPQPRYERSNDRYDKEEGENDNGH
jgi:hypothetical protein